MVTPFCSASIFGWLKDQINDITGMATQQTTSVNITVGNTAPRIIDIFIQSSVNPVDATLYEFNFSFLADDQDGISQMINASANATFTLDTTGIIGSGMQLNDTTCDAEDTGNNGTVQNYTCAITLRYWDAASDWSVNVTISDAASQSAPYNETFTYNSLTAINMTPSAMTWGAVAITSTDQLSNTNPIIVGNTGNYNVSVGNVNLSAIDLGGEATTTEYITADNFTVNIANACSTGDVLQNNTVADESITGASIATGLNLGEQASDELLYLCLEEVPQGISQQSYSTINTGSWSVGVI